MLRVAAGVSLLACGLFILRSGVSAQAQIVGRWRSLETSKGGIGAMYEFHSGGSIDVSPGAVVEMPWRIENDRIIFPPATIGGPENKSTIKWLGDNKIKLGIAGDPGGGFELTRVGDRSDADDPIIGEWLKIADMDGRKLEAHWFFYPAGKGLFLLPFVIQHGHYAISDSALHIEIPNAKPVDFRFELKDNVLILSKPEGGGESHFARY